MSAMGDAITAMAAEVAGAGEGQELGSSTDPLTTGRGPDYQLVSGEINTGGHPASRGPSWELEGSDADAEFEYEDDDAAAFLSFGINDHNPVDLKSNLNGAAAIDGPDSVEAAEQVNGDVDMETSIDPVTNTFQQHITDTDNQPYEDISATNESESSSELSSYHGSDSEPESESDSEDSLDAYKMGLQTQPQRTDTSSSPTTTTTTTKRPQNTGRCGRPLTTILDATDTIIYDLKSTGHSNKTIAARLRAANLTDYDDKTIQTRYRRIREARMAETDELLARARRRWSAAEDAALLDAYVEALQRQDEEIRKVRNRLYQTTAFLVADKLPDSFFSPEACERRYRDLMSGSAVTERDLEDPEVQRREAVRRLVVGWEWEVERLLRKEWEWEDELVRVLREQERERRKEMREERGGSTRKVRALEKAKKAEGEKNNKSTGGTRGGGVANTHGAGRGKPRGSGSGRRRGRGK